MSQPGFIKGQLHKGIRTETAESNVFINVAEWASIAAFRAAVQNPEFAKSLEGYPKGVRTLPQLTERVAIPGVCTKHTR